MAYGRALMTAYDIHYTYIHTSAPPTRERERKVKFKKKISLGIRNGGVVNVEG